jgi:hypothetical protein
MEDHAPQPRCVLQIENCATAASIIGLSSGSQIINNQATTS